MAIGGITGQIREIDAVTTSIAAAVEQQGAATQEIVRNVSQAALGAGEVTSNIVGVAQASEETEPQHPRFSRQQQSYRVNRSISPRGRSLPRLCASSLI